MKKYIAVLAVAGVVAGIVAGQFLGHVQAQPASPMQMPMPGTPPAAQHPMSTGQMMQQMQRQMAEMNTSVKALRAQLDKTNPELLTGEERPMYDYLRTLQTHLETMHGMLGTMMQMPGLTGR